MEEKPTLMDWLGQGLPFQIPHIPLVKTAQNIDKAIASIVTAGGANLAARIDANTNRIKARSAAENAAIAAASDVASSDIREGSPLTRRAIAYAFNQSILEQANREAIVAAALEDLREDPPTEDATSDIHADWLNAFSQYGSTKSDADVQKIWAKILAGEIRRPGAYKLRTLMALSAFDNSDASRVSEVLRYVIDSDYIVGKIEGPSFHLLKAGEWAGVLSSTAMPHETTHTFPAGESTGYDCQLKWILVRADVDCVVRFQGYGLNEVGKDLLKLVGRQQPPEQYVRQFAQILKGAGLAVKVGDRGRDVGGGQFELHNVVEI